MGLDTFQLQLSDDQGVLILRMKCSLWAGNSHFFLYLCKMQRRLSGCGEIKLPEWILHFDDHSLPVIQVRLFFTYSLFHFPGCCFFMLHIKTCPVLSPCGCDNTQHPTPSCGCNRSKLEGILQLFAAPKACDPALSLALVFGLD